MKSTTRLLSLLLILAAVMLTRAQSMTETDLLTGITAENLSALEPITRIEADQAAVQSLSWSADGARLAFSTLDRVLIYHTATNTTHLLEYRASDVIFAPSDPNLLVVISQQTEAPYTNIIILMDITTGAETVIEVPFAFTGAFSPDGSLFAVGSSVDLIDRVVLFETDTWTEVAVLQLQRDQAAHAIAFSPDQKWLATRNQGGGGYLWDVQKALAQRTLSINSALPLEHVAFGEALAFSPDGVLAVASDESTLLESDPQLSLSRVSERNNQPEVTSIFSGQRSTTAISELNVIHDLAFTPNGDLLIAVTEDGQLQFWNAMAGDLLHTVQETQTPILNVAVNPAGTLIATAQGNTITLWGVPPTE